LVFLDSIGGDVIGAWTLALYGLGPDKPITAVLPGDTCASACVLLLFSGRLRIVYDGARVGVHSIIDGRAGVTVAADGSTTELARALAERGMAPDVVGRLVTTPPDGMYWLTADELERSGVSVRPRLANDPPRTR
jgi:hypothetical protein